MERTIFGPDHLLFRESVRRFVSKEIVPNLEYWTLNGIVSRDIWNKAGENGLLAMAVPEQFGGDQVDLVGWCTGASVALRFAEMYPERVKTLTLLAGGFPLRDVECTWVQETVRMMAPKIAASESAAQFYHKTMFSGAKDGDEDKARFSGVLGEVDSSVVHLVSLAFRNPLALHRYSLLIGEFFAEHNERIIPPLAVKTLVMVGDADRVAHPAASAKVQSALPNSRLEILPGGDHYSVIFDDYVAESILEFTGVSGKVRSSQERDSDVSKPEVLPENRAVT